MSMTMVTTPIPGLILPHGDYAYDPTIAPPNTVAGQAAHEIALASRQAAKEFLQQLQRQQQQQQQAQQQSNESESVLLLITPHGIQMEYDFGLYMGYSGNGFATIGQDLIPTESLYNVTISHLPLDGETSSNLLQYLQSHNQSISGIFPSPLVQQGQPQDEETVRTTTTEGSSLPLYWGEILPLEILRQAATEMEEKDPTSTTITTTTTSSAASSSSCTTRKTSSSSSKIYPFENRTKYMILSLPHRRYDHAQDMVPELLELGCHIGGWMDQNQQMQQTTITMGVILSGDLSHTHEAMGPYGYSNSSLLFDTAMGRWASNPYQYGYELTEIGTSLIPNALSCGFTGFVLWQGILNYYKQQQQQQQQEHSLSKNQQTRMTTTTTTTTTASTCQRRTTSTRNPKMKPPVSQHLSGSLRNHYQQYKRRQQRQKTHHHDSSSSDDSDENQDHHSKNNVGDFLKGLQSKVYVNRNVTYYGMMAATFLWKGQEEQEGFL